VRYTVVWEDAAIDQLAHCFNTAQVPNAVSAAQHRIDRLLLTNPLANADLKAEGLYSLVVPPLYVLFDVNDADCIVRIESVRLIP
jgi:hypothetical protein